MKDDDIRSLSSIDNVPRQRYTKKTQQERSIEYESDQPSIDFMNGNHVVL